MSTYRITIALLLVLAYTGYAEESPRYIFEEIAIRNDTGETAPITEVSIWDKSRPSPLLVCKVVKQSDLIVSIMPTPVQTDAIRPTAQFVTVGNGWSPTTQFYLDERGNLFQSEEDSKDLQKKLTSEMLAKLLSIMSVKSPEFVYLTVEQNTPYKKFEEIFRLLAPVSESLGVGWHQGWW